MLTLLEVLSLSISNFSLAVAMEHDNYPIEFRNASDLEYGTLLGHGRFSSVYRGRVVSTGREVAIKVLKPLESWRLRREVHFLELCRCPEVLELVGVYGDVYNPILVTALAGDDARTPRSEAEVRVVIRGLLRALNQTHYHRVLHRDVKWGNLKVSYAEGRCVLLDFGLAEWDVVGQNLTNCGTKVYKAPEVLLGAKRYGPPVDVWGAGTVLANLLLGVPAIFAGGGDSGVLARQIAILGSAHFAPLAEVLGATIQPAPGHRLRDYLLPHTKHLFSRGAFDLAATLLRPDPAQRPLAAFALLHPWLSES